MTDRFITVPDSLELPAAVKVGVDRLHDSTVAGRALLTGADAAAQRAAITALRDTGASAHLDLSRARARHADAPLTIPTYDGSGQAVHPDVLIFATPWGGYRYWMAMTPYPNSVDTWENPSILASHDGLTWVVPAGLTNPIDSPSSGFLPDPCLVMDGGTMWCIYAGNKAKWSTDGVTWSTPSTVLTFGTSITRLSASVVKVDNTFHYWCVNPGPSPNVLHHGTGSSVTSYGQLTACTINGGPANRDLWHVAMREIRGGFVGAFTYCDRDLSGSSGRLHLATSPDGVTWTVGETPLLGPDPMATFASDAVYRSCIVPTDGTGGIWGRLWYSAHSATGEWKIAYTALRDFGPESMPELARTDALALHRQPIVVQGDARNVLSDADLLRPAAGNLVPYGWSNNLVGGTGHRWYTEDESWSVVLSSTSERQMSQTISGITLTTGDRWTFSADCRSDTTGNGRQLLKIGFLNSSDALIGSYALAWKISADWVRISVTGTVPAGAAKISLLIANSGTTANATQYWWRRAQLEQSSTATAWTPVPTTTIRLTGSSANPATGPAIKVCGQLTSTGSPVLMAITREGAVALVKYTTALRPAATTVGEGSVIYDDTLNLPIFSDGSVWKNFSGTAV